MSISRRLETMMQGHAGHDSMRAKAERMIGPFVQLGKEIPKSFSAPEHQKTRLFKKGGHTHMHKMPKTQCDLVLPKLQKSKKTKIENYEPHELKKHGGHMKKHHMNSGGLLAESPDSLGINPKNSRMKKGGPAHKKHMSTGGMTTMPVKNEIEEHQVMKKGGPSHHRKHHKHRFDMGGEALPLMTQNPEDGGNSAMNMKKGGPSHHHKHRKHHAKGGHMEGYGKGGSVYEHQMVGEHPSHSPHHYNYESEMRGEKPISKPAAHVTRGGHKDDENHHQMFRHGGYAMGGVGKMRHGQVNKAGRAMTKRIDKSK